MITRLRELGARREELVTRSSARRDELAERVSALRREIGAIEVVVASVRRLARYKTPIGIAAGIALIAAPRATARWALRLAWILPVAAEGYRLVRAIRSPETPRP